jgi:hypothetical protein
VPPRQLLDPQARCPLFCKRRDRELGNGRPVPAGVRSAVRGLADALRREMQPGA